MSASAQKAVANLATIMPNGSPQVTAVWFDLDGRYIWCVWESPDHTPEDRERLRDRFPPPPSYPKMCGPS